MLQRAGKEMAGNGWKKLMLEIAGKGLMLERVKKGWKRLIPERVGAGKG